MCQGYISKRETDLPSIGESSKHEGCLSHRTHPCEGCGRILGVPLPMIWKPYFRSAEFLLGKAYHLSKQIVKSTDGQLSAEFDLLMQQIESDGWFH